MDSNYIFDIFLIIRESLLQILFSILHIKIIENTMIFNIASILFKAIFFYTLRKIIPSIFHSYLFKLIHKNSKENVPTSNIPSKESQEEIYLNI